MSRPKQSFHLELTKEHQALVLQNAGRDAQELELTDNALRRQTETEPVNTKDQ
jgi:hypothetical protein